MSGQVRPQDISGSRDIFFKTNYALIVNKNFHFSCLFSNWLDKRSIVWFLEFVPKGFQWDPRGSNGIQGDQNELKWVSIYQNMPKFWKFLEILKNWLSLGKFSKVYEMLLNFMKIMAFKTYFLDNEVQMWV